MVRDIFLDCSEWITAVETEMRLTPAKAAVFDEMMCASAHGAEFVIEIAKTSKTTRMAPQIARWRGEGMTWEEICQRTGLKLANAYGAFKRFRNGDGRAT